MNKAILLQRSKVQQALQDVAKIGYLCANACTHEHIHHISRPVSASTKSTETWTEKVYRTSFKKKEPRENPHESRLQAHTERVLGFLEKMARNPMKPASSPLSATRAAATLNDSERFEGQDTRTVTAVRNPDMRERESVCVKERKRKRHGQPLQRGMRLMPSPSCHRWTWWLGGSQQRTVNGRFVIDDVRAKIETHRAVDSKALCSESVVDPPPSYV